MQYEFTLKFRLPDDATDMDAVVERLGECSCDDALAGVGQPGRLALRFSREAASAGEAILSAISDVRRAVRGAVLVATAPDLVGLTDVAELMGVSRQNMRKLMLSHANDFPSPVYEGSMSLWHLSDVLRWFDARGDERVPTDLGEVAEVTRQINASIRAPEIEPQMRKRLERLRSRFRSTRRA